MTSRQGGAEVVVEHLSRSFEDGRIAALADVSFRVEPGEFVAVTGPSGCGKSTLLNLIGALDRPSGGRIVVAGGEVGAVDGPRYRATVVGFVFQFHNLIPTLTALENVQVPMLGQGLPRSARVERARALLAEIGLAARERSYPPTLSGGERQRVAVARALANEPRLLLADEPTGALDTATGGQIVELLQSVRAQRGTTVLLVTNDPDVAVRADRTLAIRDGRVADAPVQNGHGRGQTP
ncbi:MAG TPA: ABC transporter ATP-binding protein [Gaiellaceae bacterium]|nr:ABC transporter ATP-binding protein [Gaiellaceae bacterium]